MFEPTARPIESTPLVIPSFQAAYRHEQDADLARESMASYDGHVSSTPIQHTVVHSSVKVSPPHDVACELSVVSRFPAERRCEEPLLFVHGSAFQKEFFDEHLLPYLAAHGFEVHAYDLRGHGERASQPSGPVSYETHMSDLRQVLRAIGLHSPILGGHSMGAAYVQSLLPECRSPAAFLLSPVPACGTFPSTVRHFLRAPGNMAKIFGTCSLAPLTESEEMARTTFFSKEFPAETFAEWMPKLGKGMFRAYLSTVLFPMTLEPERVSTSVQVIGGEKDGLFTVSEFQRTAQAYRGEAVIVPHAAHDLILGPQWEQVARAMMGFLERRGLYRPVGQIG